MKSLSATGITMRLDDSETGTKIQKMLKFAFFAIFNIFVESKWKESRLNITTLEVGVRIRQHRDIQEGI